MRRRAKGQGLTGRSLGKTEQRSGGGIGRRLTVGDPVKVECQAAGQKFNPVGFPAGRYAVSVLHDENGNGKPDMAVMIPREGFGFSRNPVVRFGPPAFARAAFAVGPDNQRQTIRMRYMF